MAIYNISQKEKREEFKQEEAFNEPNEPVSVKARDRFFSGLTARLFFLVLLAANVLWGIYGIVLWLLTFCFQLLTFSKISKFEALKDKGALTVKRAGVCGISLFIALFSPAFGIMVACTYFLTYDKAGIEEVVPSSLQAQFMPNTTSSK